MNHLIDVQGLHSFYGESHVLRGIDFHVSPVETIGLMGRNGMGKSTLLKSVMGLVKPRRGVVNIKGKNMTGHSPYQISNLGIAYVPEGRGIFGNLSVKENLIMAARSGTQGQMDWTYERVMETFPRLAERLNHGGQQLSGGEQQMLTIGRALMTNPDVLILDEATEGLAPLIRKEIWSTLLQLKGSDLSVLIVDRDLKSLSELADTFHVLEKGKIVHQGLGSDLVTEKSRIEKFLSL